MRRIPAALVAVALLAGCDGGGGPGPEGATGTTGPGGAEPSGAVPGATGWRSLAAAPTARQEVGGAAVDGRIWVVGGLTAGGASTKVEAYDPATDRWTAGPDLPLALHHLAVVAYRGELVVVGGFGRGASDLYDGPSDRVLALRGGRWVDVPRLRRPRGAAAAAVVGDVLYVVGGRDDDGLIAPTEAFDGAAWTDRAPIPTARDHVAAVSDGQAVYAVGGRALHPDSMFLALERYDPARDVWETLPGMPTARGGLAASVVGGRLIATGGESSSVVFPQVEAYDLAARTWTALAPMPTPRHGHAQATVGGAVYTLVGGREAGVAPTAVVEALSPG
jgi:N-acetylneuraminic acid mutarotase